MKQQLFTTDDAVSTECAVNTKCRGRLLAMAAGILSVLILLVTAMQFVVSVGADRYSEYSDDCRKFMMDYMKDSSSYDTLVNKTYMPYRNYVETLGRDTAFQAEMKAWELATLDLKSAAIQVTNSKEYKYHLGILMDILSDTTQNSDFISSLKNMADACHVSTTKAALKFGKEYNDLNMKLNPQDAKEIAAELSDIDTISSYLSVAGDISDLIEQSKNLDDLLNKLSQAQVIYDLTVGYADMMQDMYNRCDSDNTALKAALLTMRDLCNQSMSKVDMVALFAGSTVAEEAMKIALGEVQKEIVSAMGLTGTAITLAQSVGKMYANILFGTENIQAAYYELNALYNIENLIRESLANTTDADSFFAAFTLYEHVTYKAADYSTKYEEALYTDNIAGKLFAWVTGKDKQLEEYKKSIENCKGLVKLSFDTLQFSAYNAFIESKYTSDVSSYFNVTDKYTLPSEETITQNDENIELLSLQTCGLPDDDYTLDDDLTILNNLYHSSGTIDLNGHTLTINGDLILEGGSINVDGGELIIKGNYNAYEATTNKDGTITYSDGGYLYMNNAVDKVTVNGDFNTSFEYLNSYRKLNSGSIEIKGNLNDYYCYGEGKNTYYGLYSNGTKFIFSGTGKQTITAIDGYIYFEDVNFVDTENRELVINCQVSANLCSDTYITGDATIYGNLKGHKLEVSGNLTVNSSIDIAGGDINVGEDLYNYGNISLSGGYLTVNGNYNAYKSTTNKDGTITYSDGGYLYMNNAVDKVTVNGDFNTSFEYLNSYRKLNSGSIEIKGNLNDYYCYGEGKNTYYGLYSNGTKFIFSGTGKQTITALDGKLVLNTAEFVNKDVQIACSTDIDVDVPVRVHDYSDEWTVDKPATCSAEGSKSRHCTRCDAKTEVTAIAKIAHTYTSKVVEPTLTQQGYTLHKCSVCGYSYKDNYTPALKLTELTGVKVKTQGTASLTLAWDKNASAKGYIIEQYKGGKWTQIAKTSSNTAVTYTVNGLAADTTYTFRIKAYVISGESEIYGGYVKIAGKTRIPNVAKFTGSAVSQTAVKLDWSKNDKATGYVIEQYKGGKWTALATTKNNTTLTFTVKGLADDTAYSFRIKSYRTVNGVTDFSEYTSVKAKTLLGNVKTFTATATGTTAIKLDWSKNNKATAYVIEQYKGGKWTVLATTKNNTTLTFTVKGLAKGTTYSFRIKSFRKTGGTTEFSEYTAIKAATLLDGVSDLKVTSVTGSWITLEWAKNDKATGYAIEQYKGGKWTVIATTKNNTTLKFTVKGLKNDTTYSFRIRAYKTSGGVTAYSDYVRIAGKTRIPNVATFKGSAVSASEVKLDWSKNDKATGYVIEQYKGGKWTVLATTKNNTTLTFTVKGLAKGTTYSFRIKSFRKTGSTTEFSEYASVKVNTAE